MYDELTTLVEMVNSAYGIKLSLAKHDDGSLLVAGEGKASRFDSGHAVTNVYAATAYLEGIHRGIKLGRALPVNMPEGL